MELKTARINSFNCETGNYKNSSGKSDAFGFEYYLNEQENSGRHSHSGLPVDSTILPTYNNLKSVITGLSVLLNNFFELESIDKMPAVILKFNSEKNKVQAAGERSDLDDIQDAINSDDDLAGKIHTVLDIASHVCQMPEHLAFQKEYFTSDDPEQVIARYSYLFVDDGNEPILELKFEDGRLDIYYNNKLWEFN
jgi:hypothetical protein